MLHLDSLARDISQSLNICKEASTTHSLCQLEGFYPSFCPPKMSQRRAFMQQVSSRHFPKPSMASKVSRELDFDHASTVQRSASHLQAISTKQVPYLLSVHGTGDGASSVWKRFRQTLPWNKYIVSKILTTLEINNRMAKPHGVHTNAALKMLALARTLALPRYTSPTTANQITRMSKPLRSRSPE